MKKIIIITDRFVGFHCWPNAPAEVAFLKNLHRHIFYVTAGLEVCHNNRDKEFFIEKKNLREAIDRFLEGQNNTEWSCEDVAEFLLGYLNASFVEVKEDNENGVRIEI